MKVHPDIIKITGEDLKCPICGTKLTPRADPFHCDWVCENHDHSFKILQSSPQEITHYIFALFCPKFSIAFYADNQSLSIRYGNEIGLIYNNFEFSSFKDMIEQLETYMLFA